MAKLEVRAKVKLYYGVVRKPGHVFELTSKDHFEPRTMELVEAPAKGKPADKAAADKAAADKADAEARKEAEQMLEAEAGAANAADLQTLEAQNGEAETPAPRPRARRRRAQG